MTTSILRRAALASLFFTSIAVSQSDDAFVIGYEADNVTTNAVATANLEYRNSTTGNIFEFLDLQVEAEVGDYVLLLVHCEVPAGGAVIDSFLSTYGFLRKVNRIGSDLQTELGSTAVVLNPSEALNVEPEIVANAVTAFLNASPGERAQHGFMVTGAPQNVSAASTLWNSQNLADPRRAVAIGWAAGQDTPRFDIDVLARYSLHQQFHHFAGQIGLTNVPPFAAIDSVVSWATQEAGVELRLTPIVVKDPDGNPKVRLKRPPLVRRRSLKGESANAVYAIHDGQTPQIPWDGEIWHYPAVQAGSAQIHVAIPGTGGFGRVHVPAGADPIDAWFFNAKSDLVHLGEPKYLGTAEVEPGVFEDIYEYSFDRPEIDWGDVYSTTGHLFLFDEHNQPVTSPYQAPGGFGFAVTAPPQPNNED